MISRIIALLLLLPAVAMTQVAPSIIPSRWLPATGNWAGLAGVPGGIDQYSTNYTMYCNVKVSIPGTSLKAYGDGLHDDTAALNYAIHNAPNGTYVYIPTGKYLISGTLGRSGSYNYDYNSKPFSFIIRGDGPTNTIILDNASSGEIILLQNTSGSVNNNVISSGDARGSSSMVLSGTLPGLTTGAWILLNRNNTTANVYMPSSSDPHPYYYTYSECADQFVKVTNINGSTISFIPPLNEGFSGDLLSIYYSPPYRCGIENLAVVRLENVTAHNIRIINGQECWIRNVESSQAHAAQISLEFCGGCEIRGCYVHDPFPFQDGNNGGGSSDYGIDIGFHSSSCLVEDNIALHTRHSFILETAAGQDNVIGYNLGRDNINENFFVTDYQEDTHYHGGEPRYNLFEGNFLPILRADAVEGATKYDTYFRNLVTRDGLPSTTVAMFALDIQRGNYYDAIINNVYSPIPPTAPYANYTNYVYRLGSWEDYSGSDPSVISNNIYFGNLDLAAKKYDCITNGANNWVASLSYTFPSSLYYSSRPAWYPSGLTWPPIGGDVAGYSNSIPAQTRAAAMGILGRSIAQYTLTTSATNGTVSIPGNGSYYNSAIVALVGVSNAGCIFSKWSGYPVGNSNSPVTYLQMPASNTSVSASFTALQSYSLTVTNGSGSGSYPVGGAATITASNAPTGYAFASWTGITMAITDTNSPTTTVTMPASNIAVAATYAKINTTAPTDNVTNGLVAWWKLDDGAGTNAVDSSGNGYNGALVGSPIWAAGLYSGALALNGTSQYINDGDPFSNLTSWTVSIWWKSSNVNQPLAGRGKDGSGNGWSITINTTTASIVTTSPLAQVNVSTTNTPAANTWNNTTVTWSNGGGLSIYVNGSLAGYSPVSNTGMRTSTVGFHLGCQLQNSVYFAGTIDDVRVYSRVLGTNEIQKISGSVTSAPSSSYSLTVSNGTGSGSYPAGASAPITASNAPSGYAFANWAGATTAITDTNSPTTTVTMPSSNISVVATYAKIATTTNLTDSVTNGLVAWWKLDDGAGTNAADSSGNGYNGTLVGSPIWAAGLFTSALALNGTSQYINDGDPFSNLTSWTVSIWWKSSNVNQPLAGRGKDGSGNGWSIAIYTTTASIVTTSPLAQVNVSSTNTPAANTWNNTIVTWSNGGGLSIYINGSLAGYTPVSNTGMRTSTVGFHLGCQLQNSVYFAGTMDDVRVYGRVLGTNEIQKIVGSTPQRPPPPVITNIFQIGG